MMSELSSLTSAERIELMNAIWASLDNKDEIESPSWHSDELRLREEEIASGKAKFIPWEEAKAEIRRRTP